MEKTTTRVLRTMAWGVKEAGWDTQVLHRARKGVSISDSWTTEKPEGRVGRRSGTQLENNHVENNHGDGIQRLQQSPKALSDVMGVLSYTWKRAEDV